MNDHGLQHLGFSSWRHSIQLKDGLRYPLWHLCKILVDEHPLHACFFACGLEACSIDLMI
jgi:hypothetical protein